MGNGHGQRVDQQKPVKQWDLAPEIDCLRDSQRIVTSNIPDPSKQARRNHISLPLVMQPRPRP
jgi:hypothetical protein